MIFGCECRNTLLRPSGLATGRDRRLPSSSRFVPQCYSNFLKITPTFDQFFSNGCLRYLLCDFLLAGLRRLCAACGPFGVCQGEAEADAHSRVPQLARRLNGRRSGLVQVQGQQLRCCLDGGCEPSTSAGGVDDSSAPCSLRDERGIVLFHRGFSIQYACAVIQKA